MFYDVFAPNDEYPPIKYPIRHCGVWFRKTNPPNRFGEVWSTRWYAETLGL